jgi:aminoglycoside phosphotransferase (APT) family kinase protein
MWAGMAELDRTRDVARKLTAMAGLAQPDDLEAIPGGKNNRVYRVVTTAGETLLLKLYFHHPGDLRDRLAAEWAFLRHVWALGIRQVPQPLACDSEEHAGLYSFLPGRKLTVTEVTPDIVAAAADFIVAINQQREGVVLPKASEACFSLQEHIETVDRRIARLQQLDPQAPQYEQANVFVRRRLTPMWQQVRTEALSAAGAAGLAVEGALPAAQCCCSPSDFGLHNALVRDHGRDGIAFLDFEYAGLDDPAKLVCDFFSQPSIPPPIAEFSSFVARIEKGLGLSADFAARCRILLSVYRIKWLLIMLNDFLPIDAARRMYANGDDRALRCAEQLAKAIGAYDRSFPDTAGVT